MNKPPLVAHVIHRLAVGGLENGLVNLINYMPRERYRHVIICMTESTVFSQRILRDDIEIFELKKKEGKDFSFYPKLYRIFKKISPDIVHTKNYGTMEVQLIAALAGVQYRVHSEHGRDMDDIEGVNKKRNFIRRCILRLTQKVVPLSKNLEQWLVHTVGIPKAKIYQLYNGVDTKKFEHCAQKGSLPGLPECWNTRRIIVGAVGRIQPIKNQKILLLAFIKMIEAEPSDRSKIGLVIVGDGPEKNVLEDIIKTEKLEDDVFLAGARNDIPKLLNLFDIFILPSLNEGVSNTILEAMSCSLPVIATDVGGNPELVEDGVTGRLVEAANPLAIAQAIKMYVEIPKKIEQHGSAGRARVQKEFSIDKMVESYLRVYDELLG